MLIEHIKKWNYFNKNIIKILFVMYYQYGVVIVYHIVKVIFIYYLGMNEIVGVLFYTYM